MPKKEQDPDHARDIPFHARLGKNDCQAGIGMQSDAVFDAVSGHGVVWLIIGITCQLDEERGEAIRVAEGFSALTVSRNASADGKPVCWSLPCWVARNLRPRA